MVQQANLHRNDMVFEVGQWVYLKLQPYRQVSIHRRTSHKLSKRFYGPFRILKRIGPVAYELELPVTARIHPVFHISMLKLCKGHPSTQVSPLPDPTTFPPLNATPIAILAYHAATDSPRQIEEILVHLDGSSAAEATWEALQAFQQKFPHFNLKDKIGPQGVNNDTRLIQTKDRT